jgi:hypothetical protein
MTARWTPVHEAYLRRNWARSSAAEIAWVLGYTADQVRGKAQRMKLRRGPKRHTWTAEEDARLRQAFPETPTRDIAQAMGMTTGQVNARAHKLGLTKSSAYYKRMAREQGAAMRDLNHPARKTQFRKGHAPANKGKKGWQAGGRSTETQFKPGHRGGRALDTYKPIGTERLSKEGYLERKINDDLPLQKRWRAVHLIEWEAVNGPIPAGHCLIFINGNKQDIRLENLQLITRAENMRRNSIHRYPEEIKDTMRLVGRVKRKANKLRKARNEKQG